MATITFTPTTWVDDTTPAITAAQLNRIESAIDDVVNGGGDLDLSTNALSVGNITSTGVITLAVGTVGAPAVSFTGDSDTGIYRSATNQWGASAGGVMQFLTGDSTNAGIRCAGGSESVPGYTFNGDTDNGMYLSGTNVIGFSTGGSAKLVIGSFFTSAAIYDNTTASAANVYCSTTQPGRMLRSTSAAKYKTNIQDASDKLADIDLRPVEWDSLTDDIHQFGFIADDIAAVLPEAGDYDTDGEVENYDFRAVLAVLAAKVNRLEEAAA